MNSKFSRRHYVAIASALRRGHAVHFELGTNHLILENLIWMFKMDNPRFDESKFREAVGWE